MTKLSFGTKAETLEKFRQRLDRPVFCDQHYFDVAAWRADSKTQVATLEQLFNGRSLAIRSSTQREDGWESSHAGVFTSLIDVANDPAAITAAVKEVIASYPSDCGDDQVLVQPMVKDVVISGVVMTRELNTGSPYYTINYDDSSGRTDSVTGGTESKMIFLRRSAREALQSFRFRRLMEIILDIERIADSDELDIEFAITRSGDVFILQIRPMAVRKNWQDLSDVDHIIDATGYRGEVVNNTSKFVGVKKRMLDVTRIQKELGWRAQTPVAEGIRKTVDWYCAILDQDSEKT